MTDRTERLLASEGWGGLDAIKPQGPEAATQSRLVEVAGRVLGSDEGRVLLEHLVAMTIDRPMLPASVVSQQPVSSVEVVPYVAFREGQNAIVAHLLALLRQARQKPGG